MIKKSFSGGSINEQSHPLIINELVSRREQVPSFDSFLIASKSWDHHLIKKIPSLKSTIGANAGRQFTPADPAVVVGIHKPGFVTKTTSVDITINLTDLDPARGYRVAVQENPVSNLSMVEMVDSEIFREQVLLALQKSN